MSSKPSPTANATRPQLAHLTAAIADLEARGTHFHLRILDDQQAPVCHYDGREVINLASNNYLGLCNHPKLEEAAIAATKKYGVGSGAVRTIAGTMRIHMELEEKIAAFKNVEACVVFQSGFTANAGTVSSHPRQRRLHPLRRAQPRQHHRRRAPLPRQNQSLPPQRRRPRRRATERVTKSSPATSSSSPTASSPWTATSAPSARSPTSPKNTAPS